MRRGDIVVLAAPGDYGKPRPAVVIQADALTAQGSQSVALCLMSSVTVRAPLFRVNVTPGESSGLDRPTQIMVEKLFTVPRNKISGVIGHLSDEEIVRLNRALAFVVGLG